MEESYKRKEFYQGKKKNKWKEQKMPNKLILRIFHQS